MKVTIVSIGGHFLKSTVWGTTVVVDIGVRPHHGRQKAFVNVSCREGRIPEVRLLIRVVQVKLAGLCQLIIYRPSQSRKFSRYVFTNLRYSQLFTPSIDWLARYTIVVAQELTKDHDGRMMSQSFDVLDCFSFYEFREGFVCGVLSGFILVS